jgi:hypothetical protein
MIVTPRQFAELLIDAVHRQPNCERKVMLFNIDDGTSAGIELEFQEFKTSDKMCVAYFQLRRKTIDVKALPDRQWRGDEGDEAP